MPSHNPLRLEKLPLKSRALGQVILKMTGWMKNISPFWLGVLDAALNEGMSLCFAVFSASGEVVHANEGMKALLQITMNGERGVNLW